MLCDKLHSRYAGDKYACWLFRGSFVVGIVLSFIGSITMTSTGNVGGSWVFGLFSGLFFGMLVGVTQPKKTDCEHDPK